MPFDILIVDDSMTTRALIKRALPLTGIKLGQIYEAESGAVALQRLAASPVSLVLTDLNMPEMDGAELIAAMDASPQLRNVPVVILSTEGSKPRLDQIQRPLVAGYLRKPFTPEQLKSVLCDVTERT